MVRLADLKAIIAQKDGFILTLPRTLAGSVSLLLANLPIAGYPELKKVRGRCPGVLIKAIDMKLYRKMDGKGVLTLAQSKMKP